MKMNEHDYVDFVDQHQGKVYSQRGGWKLGDAVYNCGFSMMDDLVGKASFFQVLVLNAVGRLPEKKLADWIEASFVCLSWPDSRIWCNHIGALSAVMGTSPCSAVSAGVLASDSRMYGPGVIKTAAKFILDASLKFNNDLSVEEIVDFELAEKSKYLRSKPVIPGYSRPIANGDERIPVMVSFAEKLGFVSGGHLDLAYAVDDYLLALHGEAINFVGYCVAFLADNGFSAFEMEVIYSAWVNSGVHSCYADFVGRSPDLFLPIRCGDVVYLGVAEREVD